MKQVVLNYSSGVNFIVLIKIPTSAVLRSQSIESIYIYI